MSEWAKRRRQTNVSPFTYASASSTRVAPPQLDVPEAEPVQQPVPGPQGHVSTIPAEFASAQTETPPKSFLEQLDETLTEGPFLKLGRMTLPNGVLRAAVSSLRLLDTPVRTLYGTAREMASAAERAKHTDDRVLQGLILARGAAQGALAPLMMTPAGIGILHGTEELVRNVPALEDPIGKLMSPVSSVVQPDEDDPKARELAGLGDVAGNFALFGAAHKGLSRGMAAYKGAADVRAVNKVFKDMIC